jgi:hypothetical protein
VAETVSLPKGFEYLAPYAAIWGKFDTQEERYLQRQASEMSALQAFYDAAAPRLSEIFDHLDRFPLDALPPPEALLFRTMLGLTEAAQAVELFKQPGVPFAPFPHKMGITWTDLRKS